LICQILNASATAFGDGLLGGIGVDEFRTVGPSWQNWCPYRKRDHRMKTPTFPLPPPFQEHSKRIEVMNYSSGPYQSPYLLALVPASRTYKKINVCSSNQQVCGILSWQPKLTKTSAFHGSPLLHFLAPVN
jgi:hypothetical protein